MKSPVIIRKWQYTLCLSTQTEAYNLGDVRQGEITAEDPEQAQKIVTKMLAGEMLSVYTKKSNSNIQKQK